jgi:hypothetical protein
MVPRAASPFFMFCAPEPVLGSTEGAGSSFNVLRLGTHFRMYMGRRVRFACFTVPPVCGGTEGVGSGLHVLHSRTCFHILRYWTRFR